MDFNNLHNHYKDDYRTHVDKPGVDPTTYFAGKTSIGWT